MTQAGLDYDQCTPDELSEIIQPSGKPLWELLAQVEESKWNQQVARDIKDVPGSRIFFKVWPIPLQPYVTVAAFSVL